MVNVLNSWRHVSLSELVSFHKGGTLSKMDLAESGIPCVLYGELYTRYGEVTNRIHSRCSAVLHELTLSKEEDVLLPSSGETPEEMAKATCVTIADVGIGGDIIIARPKPGASGRFISYQLNHTLVNQVASIAQGNAIVHLNAGRLASIQTVAPGEAEQRAIAEVLSGFDEHLANLDELISKKKAVRDGALEGLMSRDLRLDGYNMPWAVRSLDEIAHSRRESSTGDPMDMDVELENLLPGEGQVVGDTSVRTAASFIFRPGDVLFGRLRPYLKKYWLATCSGLRSGEIWALAAKDGIDPRFLFHLVRTQRFLDAAGKTMGTKMPRADWSLLKTESFEVPEVDEQRAIAEVLSGMDEEIRLLAEERAKVERLKLGAMDDLLTGRVRLPLEEEAA